jgi:hypothetical protein
LVALCARLIVVAALAACPVAEAVQHGPGALAAEVESLALAADHGHSHTVPGDGHDTGEHDHVVAVVLPAAGDTIHPAPDPRLRPEVRTAQGAIRDGPRRPPRRLLI